MAWRINEENTNKRSRGVVRQYYGGQSCNLNCTGQRSTWQIGTNFYFKLPITLSAKQYLPLLRDRQFHKLNINETLATHKIQAPTLQSTNKVLGGKNPHLHINPKSSDDISMQVTPEGRTIFGWKFKSLKIISRFFFWKWTKANPLPPYAQQIQ
jgi:hypothetical protein